MLWVLLMAFFAYYHMGNLQNRLEHIIANPDTAAENTQNIESRIRNVNIAEERMKYSKNNILAQSSAALRLPYQAYYIFNIYFKM